MIYYSITYSTILHSKELCRLVEAVCVSGLEEDLAGRLQAISVYLYMYVYVCVYVYLCIYVYVYMSTCLDVYSLYVYMSMCLHVCMSLAGRLQAACRRHVAARLSALAPLAYLCVYIYNICIPIYTLYIYMYIYIYTYLSLSLYIYIYIYMHTQLCKTSANSNNTNTTTHYNRNNAT